MARRCRRSWSRGVLDWLAERGYADVEEVRSAEESLLFALPPELRRDMKSRDMKSRDMKSGAVTA